CLKICDNIRHLCLRGYNDWGPERCDVLLLGSIPSLPNLEILEFMERWQIPSPNDGVYDDLDFEGSQSVQQPWLCLPQLRVLKFEWMSYDLVHAVFSRLDAPKLDMLVLGAPFEDCFNRESGNQKLPNLSLVAWEKQVSTVRIVGVQLSRLQGLIEDIPNYASHSFEVEFIPSWDMIPPKESSFFSSWPDIPCEKKQTSSEWEELRSVWKWATDSIDDLKWLRPLRHGEEFDRIEGIDWGYPSLEEAFDFLERHRQAQVAL
ncbi:hypothetical protein FRC01_005185, partial [Tulasnella sp. 417]